MLGRQHLINEHPARKNDADSFRSEATPATLRPVISAAAHLLLLLLRHLTTKRVLVAVSLLSVAIWAAIASRAEQKIHNKDRLPRNDFSFIRVNKNTITNEGPVDGIFSSRSKGSPWIRSSHKLLSPRSSLWLPAYRNFTGERCDRLLLGNTDEQQIAHQFIKKHRASFWCYRDRLLANATCSRLLHAATAGGLGRRSAEAPSAAAGDKQPKTSLPLSYEPLPEELDFPLAFSLRMHTCATQVELLLRAIYAPQNFYCLHADGGAAPEFLAAIRRLAYCLPNVHLAPVRNDFVYRSASQMESDVECMDAALQSPVTWRYFINLAGQELPLISNYELVLHLRSLNGSSHVNVMPGRTNANRYAFVHWCRDSMTNRTVKCPLPLQRKAWPPGGARVQKSSAYGLYSRALVEFMRAPEGIGRRLYAWFADTMCPEEHYFATVVSLPQAPGGYAAGARTRAVKWRGSPIGECRSGHYVRGVCVFGTDDLPRLLTGGHAIANKFYFNEDPIAVRCLVDNVMRRKADPDRRLCKPQPLLPLWLSQKTTAEAKRTRLYDGGRASIDSAQAAAAVKLAADEPIASDEKVISGADTADELLRSEGEDDKAMKANAAEEAGEEAYYQDADPDGQDKRIGVQDGNAIVLSEAMASENRMADEIDEAAADRGLDVQVEE